MGLITKINSIVEMISCVKCGQDMPKLRKTQYGYDFCVGCSTIGAKKGLPVQFGSGDHTWTETIIMEETEYAKHTSQDIPTNKTKSKAEFLNFDQEDERNLQGPFNIIGSNEE